MTPHTSAIVVAHIAGYPADVKGIAEVAKRHGLPLIEDCAQSHGAQLHGKYVGTFGDVATVSTMWDKHMNTGGQGGVVFTREREAVPAVTESVGQRQAVLPSRRIDQRGRFPKREPE